MTVVKSCKTCRHCTREYMREDWEQPQYDWVKYWCTTRPQNSNLRSFPFAVTNCAKYEAKP